MRFRFDNNVLIGLNSARNSPENDDHDQVYEPNGKERGLISAKVVQDCSKEWSEKSTKTCTNFKVANIGLPVLSITAQDRYSGRRIDSIANSSNNLEEK